ncbi:hypothetical protein MMC18_004224 [Xylographa bjoerkii]|nr:hypothetical protein [Xylographa bjoerkii]
MAEVPLSDLCTICHFPPKYRCPRCSARTCSLACSKRHKQWAQCSGVRNPAAYLKRHELASPKYFDQDYNFISGIERRIETAERSVTARGVQLQETRSASKRDGPMKGEVNLRQALDKSGVIIERAPVGMKRSLQNKTSWNKSQRCIAWTVEWITNNDTADLGTCLETQTLSQAYAKHIREPPPAKKRKLSKKKSGNSNAASVPKADSTDPAPLKLHSAIGSSPPNPSHASSLDLKTAAQSPLSIGQPSVFQHAFNAPSQSFYLHIPNPKTPSSKPTLLPLSPSKPLSELLRSRLVREFPTVYVLDNPPKNLPPEKYTLQRDLTGEVAAELAGILDEGKEEGEERSEGEMTDDDTGKFDGEGGHRTQIHGTDCDEGYGKSRTSDNAKVQDGEGDKDVDEPAGTLATGHDELSWIMREVI